MEVVTHTAVSPLVPVHMKLVQVTFPVPETGSPFSLLRLQKVGVVTEETELEIGNKRRQVIFFGIRAHQQSPELGTMCLVTGQTTSTRNG